MPYPPGDSAAFIRSFSLADASLFEHFSQGIRTVRLPTNNPSPSGVVSMAVAVIGSVACISFASKSIVPFSHDQIKVVKDDFAHFTPQPRRQIIGPRFLDFVNFRPQPIFAFRFSFTSMNVNRFIAFVWYPVRFSPDTSTPPGFASASGGSSRQPGSMRSDRPRQA